MTTWLPTQQTFFSFESMSVVNEEIFKGEQKLIRDKFGFAFSLLLNQSATLVITDWVFTIKHVYGKSRNF